MNLRYNFENQKKIYLLPAGDMHLGASKTHLDRLDGYIAWVKRTPNAYVLLTGDIFENATVTSVGSPYDSMNPEREYEMGKRLLEPIKKKILACCKGNHENRSQKLTDFNPLLALCDKLDIPYTHEDINMKVKVGNVVYYVYATHGSGGGCAVGGKAMRLYRLSQPAPTADVLISGHIHQCMTYTDAILVGSSIKKRVFVSSGSMLGYSGYASNSSMQPSWPGYARIRLDGVRRDVHVSI